jgi:uncharacterized protein (TIGR03435 family)
MSQPAHQPAERPRGAWSRIARFTALATLMTVGFASRPLSAQDIAGTWQGTLAAAQEQTAKPQRIVVKITKDPASGWQGVAYSLDSNMAYEGRVTTQMSLQGTDLHFAIAPIDSSYQGKLSPDGATLTGTWTQNGTAHPLVLARVNGDAAWEIPKPDAIMAKDADPDWDVLSVKAHDPSDPSNNQSLNMKGRQFVMMNRTVQGMLLFAYGLHKKEIVGTPGWVETERWDAQGLPDVPGHPSLKQMQSLMRKLLEQRFGLKVHKETKELAVYAITVGKTGERISPSAGDPNGTPSENENLNGGVVTMRMTNMTMAEFAPDLAFFLDRPAVDQTGLKGRYDLQLKWTADESKAPPDGTAPPGMFTAIQEQLGLKLEPAKAPVEVLVVDAVEKPTAN